MGAANFLSISAIAHQFADESLPDWNDRVRMHSIAIDARSTGGIGRYTRNLVRGLAGCDSFTITALTAPSAVPEYAGLGVRTVAIRAPLYSVREQWQILQAAGVSDLLHVPHYNIPIAFKGSLVVTIHDLIHLTDRHYLRSPKAFVYSRTMLRVAVQRAARIISVSEFSAHAICERLKVPESRITVIHNGVEPIFAPRPDDEQRRLSLRALGRERPYILYVGALRPHKNIEILIRAFALLKRRGRFDGDLVLVGRGFQERALRELVRGFGLTDSVAFAGYIEEPRMPDLYSGAAMVVLPSRVEGFGLPIAEAMACGTPVLCSRTSSLPEIAGDCGHYFDPENLEELVERVLDVLERPSETMQIVQRGLLRVKRFSWAKSVAEHRRAYEAVFGTRNPGAQRGSPVQAYART
jgi:glycosyltransferase involved in cell wall biosynthesis